MRKVRVSCYVLYIYFFVGAVRLYNLLFWAVVLGTYVDAPEFLNGAECDDFLQQIVPVIALVIIEVSDWGFGWSGKR